MAAMAPEEPLNCVAERVYTSHADNSSSRINPARRTGKRMVYFR